MKSSKIRTYSELSQLKTFDERFEYLVLSGIVGHETFGTNRYLNQKFYQSKEWKAAREKVIIRDNACDLGILGLEIYGKIYVHHINPITLDDIYENLDLLLNPEFLISTSFNTHQGISFGTKKNIFTLPRERRKGDTTLWK